MPINSQLKTNSIQTSSLILLGLLAVLALAGMGYFNLQFSTRSPGGNDFLAHWVGARALFLEGVSPYSDSVAQEIQQRAYGRPALPGENKMGVAYPLYSVFLFGPFALVEDYNLARALWMTLLELCLLGASVLAMQLFDWKPGLLGTAFFLVFSLTWYYALRGLINGNAEIVVAFLFVAALWAIRRDRDAWAGVLLALATIKPQVGVLFMAFILLWALSYKRWKLIGWTMGSVAGLSLLGMFWLPDWPLQNLREILKYPGYNPPGTPAAVFGEWWGQAGTVIGWGLTLVILGVMLYEWQRAWGKDYRHFVWTACLTLVASPWSGIQTDPGNFIVLIPALALVLAAIYRRWPQQAGLLAGGLLLALWIGLWALFLNMITYEFGQAVQHPVMFFPLPLVLLVGLYAARSIFMANESNSV